jgi:Mg-chelatase subunit ChlD
LARRPRKPYLVQNFTDNAELLESSIRRLTPNGNTAVWDAVRYTSDVLKAPADSGAVRRVLILITDGEDNAPVITY